MKFELESLSFGRYLQSIRLEKKISLEKVSEETRIGLGNLLLIEKEDLDRLPAQVFVKGFLRAYARAIGADGEEAVRLYQARLKMVTKLAGTGGFSGRSGSKLWRQVFLSVATLFGIIILSLYAVEYFENRPSLDEPRKKHVASVQSKQIELRSQQDSGAQKDSKAKIAKRLLLHITVLEDTYLKVIIDDNDPKEYSLVPGENLNLEATSGYNLLIGSAGGVKMILNGEPISVPGKSGEVVNLQIP